MNTSADRAATLPGIGEQLSYVSGEFSSNFAWNMVAGYLLFYYTDIAFLPVAALGTLMLVTRIADAVFDPLVGVAVDRTRSRWGHARPYLLWGAIPFGLLFVLTFAVPDWAPGAKVAYAYATFTLLGLLYSVLYIPFGALQPMMVQDPRIKVRLGSWRSMGTAIASMVVYSLVLPLVGTAGPGKRAAGFTFAAAVIGSISVALYLLVFFKCRERFVTKPSGLGKSVGTDLARLFRNRVWVMSFSYVLLTFVRLGVMVTVTAYFANNVLQRPALLAILLPLLSVAILAGGLLASILMGRFGQRQTNVAFLVLSMACYLLLPYVENNTAAFVGLFMLANVGGGIIGATVFISVADAVVYNEAKFGDRNEGLMFAGVSFGMKAGVAVGAAATAYALSWSGYDPHVLSTSAAHMIRILFYYVPVAMSVLQIACIQLLRYERSPDGVVSVRAVEA